MPDDVPLRIELPSGESYTGQLVGTTSFEVTLACGVRLPEKLGSASLTLDASFILEQIIARLDEFDPEASDLPLALFGFRNPRSLPKVSPLDDREANEFQLAALAAVLERDVTYVWGPPGTGKTTTLALIAEGLVRRGMRVLAVASTNVGVDNAIVRIAERLRGEGVVARLGTPQLATVRGGGATERAARGSLIATMPLPLFGTPRTPRQGEAAQHEEGPTGRDNEGGGVVVIPSRRLPDQREEAARQRSLRDARVVGATLSRIALTPELATPGFDAVLVDEASAAPLPSVFVAAALARSKVVALGDPRQLPPVAVSNGPLARRWLQRDIFAQAGLDDDDGRAVLLREQYRMPAGISRLANELAYGGRLIDAPGLKRQAGGAHLVDTSHEGAHCERQDGSRLNHVHAEIAVELARDHLSGAGAAARSQRQAGEATAGIAIITPYRAQARLIWRLLRDARLEKNVDVGTVHRFQGLERQAIIFDTVEAPPERPAPFVAGTYGSEAMRLINVAITRAQSELFVVANVAHLHRTLRRDSTLLGLLRLLSEGSEEGDEKNAL